MSLRANMIDNCFARLKNWLEIEKRCPATTIKSADDANLRKDSTDTAELIAANLALQEALDEAITEYQDAIAYKSEYLIEKHHDLETIDKLKHVLDSNKRPAS